MFLDWKKQYCEIDYTTQRIFRLNTIPVKLPMAFFIQLEPKILLETQRPQVSIKTQSFNGNTKTPSRQSSLKKEK